MLTHLEVRDIVLVERLELELGPGFTVLTGETGTGKSILLDALGFALGARAERALLRAGAERAMVAARFELRGDDPLRAMLGECGIEVDEELVLRRTLGADGRGRAFINDAPVSGTLLRRVGETLVAIHGQQASRSLLQPAAHRRLLDLFAGNGELLSELRGVYERLRAVERERAERAAALDALRREQEELRHRIEELERLDAREGEEEELAARRHALANREKLATLLGEALELLAAADERLLAASRRTERAVAFAGEGLQAASAALERSAIELREGQARLEEALRDLELDHGRLEEIEERLFVLRDAARKYRCTVDELPAVLERSRTRMRALEADFLRLEEIEGELREVRGEYRRLAAALGARRREAAARLEGEVARELPPLRLGRARFRVAVEPLEEACSALGSEQIRFLAATNPGQPPAPLDRIASGGELARFMLALEVVLARIDPVATMIFDEVDAGIGGATADAVGERLARLARERQVLVVTHAPQIAARADRHLRVVKRERGDRVHLEVAALDAAGRREELARMLAGARITDAARAAAESLLVAAGGAQ